MRKNRFQKQRMSLPKRNIVTTLLNQLITTACGILIPRILIGEYGSEAYGISVSITQFLSYITLLESGIGGVARAELYGPLARGEDEEISAVYWAVRRFFLGVSAAFVIYSVGLGISFYDIAHVSLFSRRYVFFLVLVIGLSTLAKYMGGLANLTLIVADQKQYVNNLILAATTLINTLSVVVLAKLNAGLIWVKLGSSLIFVVRPLLYAVYVKRHYRLTRVRGKRAVLKQKWTGIGQHIAYFLHTNTDVFLLTLFARSAQVAVYSVYNLVSSSIRAITESFSGGMEALFGALYARGEQEELKRVFRKYQVLLTGVSFVLFSCAGILIVSFVRLYTAGITDADYIQPGFAVTLLLAEAVNCMMLPYTCLPVAANRLKQTRWGAYGETILNIGISCILIWWKPLLGVAVGTLAATLFRGIYYMCYSSRCILKIILTGELLRFAVVFAGMSAVMLAGQHLLQRVVMENFLQWILWGGAVFCVLALPAFLFWKVWKKHRGMMR